MKYNPTLIEKKWQDFWKKNNTFKVDIDTTNPNKYYCLDMFPYPSGKGLHVGHPEGYTATDIVSRYKKQKGYEVLHPMGWDAFGLPAEQYAIKTNNSPKEFTKENIQNFKSQLDKLGFTYDWNKEINTSDPNYYKWTQWIFAQLYKHDLAEIKEIPVNWCEDLNTVLANEEIYEKDGKQYSERDDFLVIQKTMKQWVLKITKYADRLFENIKTLEWPSSIKRLQSNWIYRLNKDTNKLELNLHDWLFSRQRYWGEPFPIVYKENGEIYLIPETKYPINLPEIKDYKFSKDGEPALSRATDWVNYDEEVKGVRDLNTMPQWAGSSWYYMAYILKQDDGTFLELGSEEAKTRLNKWMPVDLYIGGQEHATLHLLYARFWSLFLRDINVYTKGTGEPFSVVFNQGMILGPNGIKMSKSKGNVVNPDDVIKEFGADSLRLFLMFLGPLDDDKPWSSDGIFASKKWLDRVWNFFTEIRTTGTSDEKTKYEFNQLLESVESMYLENKFNTAISKMQIFMNYLYKHPMIEDEIAIGFLQMLSCITPHICDELYSNIISKQSTLYNMVWPIKFDNISSFEVHEIVFQINGKVRLKIESDNLLDQTMSKEDLIEFAKTNLKDKLTEEIKEIRLIRGKLISITTNLKV